jgi:hypothetical protein
VNQVRPLTVPTPMWRVAVLAGVALGIVYALSPLTIWFAVAIVPVVWYGGRGLDADERGRVTRLVILAVALRLVALAALFLATNHAKVPFGSFFGDEEYFIGRSLWLRNVALGIPVHGDDLRSAFESFGAPGYFYLLALVQILVGPAPYGLHLLGILFYVAAVIVLYRLVRSSLGRTPALVGLTVLLFLPSLFAWSVSVLREPLFMLLNALNLTVALKLARGPSWRERGAALAAGAALVMALEGIRPGGGVLGALGVLTGLGAAFVARRPRVMLAALVATPIVLSATLARPNVQLKAYVAIQTAVRQHWGTVATPGYTYELLDDRFYPDIGAIPSMTFSEAMRFLLRGAVAYVVVPLPWKVESRSALVYLPEQVVWYVIAALAPFGFLSAFRRDGVVAGLLLTHAILAAGAVAFTEGNIGTLVRHRGLAIPYVVWVSAVGMCELLTRRSRLRADRVAQAPLPEPQPCS